MSGTNVHNEIAKQLEAMGASNVVAMRGYVQARFTEIAKAASVRAAFLSHGLQAEVTEDPAGEGFYVAWAA